MDTAPARPHPQAAAAAAASARQWVIATPPTAEEEAATQPTSPLHLLSLHLHCPAATRPLGLLSPLGNSSSPLGGRRPPLGRPLHHHPSRLPATVQEVQPGRAQLVTVGALPFLNIHAESNDLTAYFNSLLPHLDSPISPVLVGDFNCIQEPLDCTPGLIRHTCQALGRILRTYS
jgi:hypothetical protein